MRNKQVMQITRMATVREGTRMPQSLKYAWRWLMGASAAAMLIASIPASANAQTDGTPPLITLCVSRNGKVVGINLECRPHQIQLTWNIPGPVGAPGFQGDQGRRASPVKLVRLDHRAWSEIQAFPVPLVPKEPRARLVSKVPVA